MFPNLRPYESSITYERVRPLLKWVYVWMAFGLLITTVVAYLTNINVELATLRANPPLVIGALIAEVVIVLVLSWGIQRISAGLAAALFMLYAGLNGFTLSILLLYYTEASIVAAFATTVGLFAALSVIGFTTKIDLTQYGSYLLVGLIGLLIALVVNMFLRSSGFDLIISIFGVLLFTGLTAYDTQMIKRMAEQQDFAADSPAALRFAIFGALRLYLDFINLFIYLLRLFGRRR